MCVSHARRTALTLSPLLFAPSRERKREMERDGERQVRGKGGSAAEAITTPLLTSTLAPTSRQRLALSLSTTGDPCVAAKTAGRRFARSHAAAGRAAGSRRWGLDPRSNSASTATFFFFLALFSSVLLLSAPLVSLLAPLAAFRPMRRREPLPGESLYMCPAVSPLIRREGRFSGRARACTHYKISSSPGPSVRPSAAAAAGTSSSS
ncbi:hypothetical protein CDD83_4355 [Cordyceps sp. RAO-2017]|nr:hypothetical protein CDD83_4355 [Cordyceps sp. RAO-2017]